MSGTFYIENSGKKTFVCLYPVGLFRTYCMDFSSDQKPSSWRTLICFRLQMSRKLKYFTRCSFQNEVGLKPERSMEQLIAVGQVDSSDTLGTTLHHSAYVGNKRALKKVLDKGIHVDYPNDEGQTPLFCACLGGHESVVAYLLSSGADPNEKTNQGLTALHAASYTGNVKIMMKLLKEGGDLRLHDHQGRSVKDWAMLNPTPRKRMKILEFLDKTRMFAMSSSGQDLLMRKASSKTIHRAHHRRNTVTKIIRDRIGHPSIHTDLERMAASQHSLGFGHVYSNGTEKTGFMSAIPLVSENNLKHDPVGETYNNGAFCVMESAWWDYSQVTIKRLHRELDPYQGGVVDLLINEVDHIGKLRHPNVLTLMGVCQTSNLDGLILIYERIAGGSLYNYLHQKMERLPSQMIEDIALQLCDAIIFIHLQGLIHSAITSHAVSVINSHTFKLGNFEYMIDVSKCEWGKKNAVASNTAENAVYNWMAPEVMFNMPPSFYCDMFSFCAVLWEIFHGDVPWDNQCSENIKSHYSKGDGLRVHNGKIQEYYKVILDFGLQQEPAQRQLSFLHVRDLLQAAPKDANNFVRTHFQHLRHHDDDGGSQSRSVSKPDSTNKQRDQPGSYQPSTSKNIDSNISDKQRRKDKERRKHDRGNKEYKMRMEADQKYGALVGNKIKDYLKEDEHGWRKERAVEANSRTDKRDERSTIVSETYQHETPTKPFRQLHYSTDGISWEGVPRQVGEEFQYTVNLRKETSPAKVSDAHREHRREETQYPGVQRRSCEYKESTETETNEDSRTKTCDSTDSGCTSSDVPVGRELKRKTSSMGNFSYLALSSHQRAKSAGAKPACHGQYEAVAEEYSTTGKLTTAGSLYSLYNEHSPNLPLGQLEIRRGHPKYVTLPRRKQTSKPLCYRYLPVTDRQTKISIEQAVLKKNKLVLVEADPAWFGGRGSVRNLAQVFQQQIKQHDFNQAVLDGTVNKEHSMEKICDSSRQNIYFCVNNNKEETKNIHQIAFDVGDDSDSMKSTRSSSSFTTGTSSESHAVSQWVDHELRKIKRKLSKEMMSKHSLSTLESHGDINQTNIVSPELFDKSDNHVHKTGGSLLQKDSGDGSGFISSSECTEITPETSNTSLTCNDQEKGDYVKCAPMEEFFFDDEMYPSSSRNQECASNRCSPWNSQQTSPVHRPLTHPKGRHNSQENDTTALVTEEPLVRSMISNLPMRTMLKKTESPKNVKHVISTKTDDRKKRMSRIPTSRSKLTASKSNNNEEAFANITTVRSSLDELGRHKVTHQVKNLKTGGSSTMLNKLVNGQRIVTTFKAMS